MSEEARGNNAGIVEDKEFVAAKERGEFEEGVIFKFAGDSIQQEETGLFAAGQRSLRDLVMWEIVVQFVETHREHKSIRRSSRSENLGSTNAERAAQLCRCIE